MGQNIDHESVPITGGHEWLNKAVSERLKHHNLRFRPKSFTTSRSNHSINSLFTRCAKWHGQVYSQTHLYCSHFGAIRRKFSFLIKSAGTQLDKKRKFPSYRFFKGIGHQPMTNTIIDPRGDFIELVDLTHSKVLLEPRIMFICGGPVDVETGTNHSIRNMFMNLSGGIGDKADGFVLAENFKDWERGYKSLSDFENDVAYISSLVVIFLESEGALTEFGLFFANQRLRKKLVVVLHDVFHKSESFIKFGLLNPMERNDQESVRVYEIDHRQIETVSKDEVKDILDDVIKQSDEKNKTEKFNTADRGHQIFLIYQLLDLFLSLTKSEISTHMSGLKISHSRADLDSALYILQKFNLIGMEKKSSQYFYYVPTGLRDRIDLHFSIRERRYDTATIKIAVGEFYREAAKSDPTHKRRMKVIQSSPNGGAA